MTSLANTSNKQPISTSDINTSDINTSDINKSASIRADIHYRFDFERFFEHLVDVTLTFKATTVARVDTRQLFDA